MGQSGGMRYIKLLAIPCGFYLAVIVAMYFGQSWLIFPAYMVSDSRPALPDGAVQLELVTAEGDRLHGIHVSPQRSASGYKTVVIGFAGNGWHAEGMALDLRRHFPDRDIVVFNYRGYRPSGGRPSAAALLADGLHIHDHVQQTLGPARTFAVGYSLGSGVAAFLARERPLAGLILVTPFDALEAVAQQRYPWAPVRWLIRHHMPSVDFLRGLTLPTAVIAAERDVIVPPERTAALRRGIGNLVLDRTLAGAQHNDIFSHPDFGSAMAEAMERFDAKT